VLQEELTSVLRVYLILVIGLLVELLLLLSVQLRSLAEEE
jgi:hypothetical protein